MTEHGVKFQFDKAAANYDVERRGLIPCFDEFYGAAVGWTEIKKEKPRILDLGAGTGLLSAMLLEKFPYASMTLIDFSEEMLQKAKSRFQDDSRVTYIAADYTNYDFAEPFDAVVSALSIHHLSHQQKQALFAKIRGWLTPGGLFMNADQTAAPSDSWDQIYRRAWIDSVRRSGLSESALEASLERRKQDINAGLREQLGWLDEAGFSESDCVYKSNEFTVYVAYANPVQ
ncbi:methyltransferase [Paenibacillus oryzae]|uniref:Methyltransferase n=1 Tax=Paenibacillus oryzae TaxID=1844972 RepID=A0A1A5YL55_9BACL|nr:class I SAM-dependent methyltransferase [Paenibacillus oryzae]OBR66268.1 methyltransferase [Paenibacillus oryzae]